MNNLIKRFSKDESGATAIEYALIGSLIAIAIIAGAGALGTQLDVTFGGISDVLKANTPSTT